MGGGRWPRDRGREGTAFRRARLRYTASDPFALPARTTLRFCLLVVATLAAGYAPMVLNLSAFPALEALVPSILAQSVLSMAAVAAGALVVWWMYPAIKVRRRRLRPLPAAGHGELTAALGELCREAGLPRAPTFLWNPREAMPTAVAFGRVRRWYVALSGGLVVLFRRDPAAFRAILFHELAHLGNGDVGITYLAMAMWWSFVALVLVPFVLFGLFPGVLHPTAFSSLAWLAAWPWRIVGLGLLVYLVRNSVLRTREVYADLRAATWDGPSGALRRILEGQPRRRRPWLGPFAVHPDPRWRRRLLDDPGPLFEVGFWESLATGCVLGLANVGLVGRTAVPVQGEAALPLLVLEGFAVSCLAGGAVGLDLWRAIDAARARGRRPRGRFAVALGLAAGLMLGPNLSLDAPVLELTGRGHFAGLRPALPDLLVDLYVVAGALLVVGWISATAAPWLAWRRRSGRPRLADLVGLLVVGVVLGALVVLGFLVMLLVGTTGRLAVLAEWPLTMLLSPVGALVATILWAFPLAAHLLGRTGEAVDPVPVREALIGLGIGLGFWPLYLIEVVGLRPPGFLSSPAVAFCLVQALAGGAVAARASPPAVPRGLLVAFITACVTAPVAITLVPGRPSVPTLVAAWLNGGTLAALPFALLGSALGARRRRARAPG